MELLTPLMHIEKSVEHRIKGLTGRPAIVVSWSRHDYLSGTRTLLNQKSLMSRKEYKYKYKNDDKII